MLEPGSVDDRPACGFVHPSYLCRETDELNVFYKATGSVSGLLALPADCGWDHKRILSSHWLYL